MDLQTLPPNSDEQIAALLDEVMFSLGLELTGRQRSQLQTHFSLLLKWNRKINLTSIRSLEEIATRHFEESLFLSTLVPAPPGLLMDIGSGAGFPGLPLKIAWPAVETVLLEPNQKKATFLKEVVRSCGLEGIAVRPERLESIARGDSAGRAALVTMRAVAPTPAALADTVRLLSPGGQIALYTAEEEAKLLPAPGNFEWSQRSAIPHSLHQVILLGHRRGG